MNEHRKRLLKRHHGARLPEIGESVVSQRPTQRFVIHGVLFLHRCGNRHPVRLAYGIQKAMQQSSAADLSGYRNRKSCFADAPDA